MRTGSQTEDMVGGGEARLPHARHSRAHRRAHIQRVDARAFLQRALGAHRLSTALIRYSRQFSLSAPLARQLSLTDTLRGYIYYWVTE